MRVVTVGSFDPLHQGHLDLFADARRLAGADGEVIVGVNSDDFYRRHRGTEPFQPLADRLRAVQAHGHLVDQVYINDRDDEQIDRIAAWGPDILLVGLDWGGDHYLAQIGAPSWEWFRHRGILVAFTPRHGSISGTALREAARDR